MNVVAVEDVWKTYHMGEVEVNALRGASFTVDKGDYVIIMGPSGSGKSTLLHVMSCLDQPTKGKVFIDNIEVSEMSGAGLARIRNQKIGFIFQTFNLLPRLTALENGELPMSYCRVPPKKRRERMTDLLELVGLGDRMHHRPTQLSGGEQQRVAIARALANDPPVLVADEPTGNLDTKSGREILQLFGKLHGMGKTLVVVTHDEAIAHEGRRIVHLLDGVVDRIEVNE